jgi:hypothetical protein
MTAYRLIGWLVGVATICAALAGTAAADPAEYQVIVNPANPITSIEAGYLRNAYLKKVSDWSDGHKIRPIDLAPRFTARARFAQHVLKKTMPQLRSFWTQRVFSGKGVPPPEVETTAAVIAYVLANPGAVGYLPAGVDAGRAKVIGIR